MSDISELLAKMKEADKPRIEAERLGKEKKVKLTPKQKFIRSKLKGGYR